MNEIIYVQEQGAPPERFYAHLQKEIPKLTKEPFDCPEIVTFYSSQ